MKTDTTQLQAPVRLSATRLKRQWPKLLIPMQQHGLKLIVTNRRKTPPSTLMLDDPSDHQDNDILVGARQNRSGSGIHRACVECGEQTYVDSPCPDDVPLLCDVCFDAKLREGRL
jgi:hypothetical protein